ncbi:MAG: trans-2-enoyl-CoA reductase family protein [Verrucomicrobiales bacterium]|jgi:enoyl-[acyl-carrier protein] reductase/trans-2-enoyl-CoA reductase (NAD+)|nr:trans-2-enoyl-CoA reductase family protein [Verrucomicrobiales bacterium]
MIIRPKIRGFICVTAHPQGCATHVREQIDYVKSKGTLTAGPKRVLVIGSSTGYGLASRITAAFGCGAKTIGVFFEKAAEGEKLGTAGWYNSVAFEQAANREGLYAKSFNGDAFSDELKTKVVEQIRKDWGQVDQVIYSLASPRRTNPRTGESVKSCLKPIGTVYKSRTLDTDKAQVLDVSIEPATEQEIADTIKVMGGEDWIWWMEALEQAGVLAPGCTTLAYSYIGPEITHAVYTNGTIGAAKKDLEQAAAKLNAKLAVSGGYAHVSVNKALVTQASSAIPVVPLYISILYKIMKEKGLHEGCIEQMQRLYADHLANGKQPVLDANGRIRIDDWEMKPEIQAAVAAIWPTVTTENLKQLTDFEGYQKEFLKLFGFGLSGVDYEADSNPAQVDGKDAVLN